MPATHATHSISPGAPLLYMSLELGKKTWKLAFTTGAGQPPRIRTVSARRGPLVREEISKAKARFRLPDDTPVLSCYEAGPDAFWIHRYLLHHGVQNIVVDSSSIEVNRRLRRAKSDRLDASKLVSQLIRWHNGEKKVWSVVRAPTVADEDARQLHRELVELKEERTRLVNRIRGLLAAVGEDIVVAPQLPKHLEMLTQWDGSALPEGLKMRIVHAYEQWMLVMEQIHQLETDRREKIRTDTSVQAEMTRRLMTLRGIGENGAWLLAHELGWRDIRNRRQLGSLSGLAPTPYDSGTIRREQGISKAGNRLVRWMMVQLAWGWLRYQPESDLSRWYVRRFGGGNSRQRKVGIVALARKLLIALWKYLKTGEPPGGARMRKAIVVSTKKEALVQG
jgi:transposase